MITPYIEKMIHEGRAAFRSYCCGLAGVYRLPIPDNHYIILTDLYFNDFNDATDPEELLASSVRCNQRIYITSTRGNKVNILHRSFVVGDKSLIADYYRVIGREHYEMYCIASGTLKVSVGIMPLTGAGAGMVIPDYSAMNTEAQDERADSIGYGTGAGTAGGNLNRLGRGQVLARGVLYEYQPMTQPLTVTNVAPAMEQYTPPVGLEINAPNLHTLDKQFAMPQFTFFYVEVFEPLPAIMKF